VVVVTADLDDQTAVSARFMGVCSSGFAGTATAGLAACGDCDTGPHWLLQPARTTGTKSAAANQTHKRRIIRTSWEWDDDRRAQLASKPWHGVNNGTEVRSALAAQDVQRAEDVSARAERMGIAIGIGQGEPAAEPLVDGRDEGGERAVVDGSV